MQYYELKGYSAIHKVIDRRLIKYDTWIDQTPVGTMTWQSKTFTVKAYMIIHAT